VTLKIMFTYHIK